MNHPCAAYTRSPLVSHSVAVFLQLDRGDITVLVLHSSLLHFRMAPMHRSGEAGHSGMCKRSREELPVSDKECMYRGKRRTYRVPHDSQFQARTRGLGTSPTCKAGLLCRCSNSQERITCRASPAAPTAASRRPEPPPAQGGKAI